ncbi:MAG: hypothetical protein QOH14_2196 [Pseudonocardiales bacterium]|jgi:hypothetical protein|nr:hypothetical protein [Pseudonocardiales bacterium]
MAEDWTEPDVTRGEAIVAGLYVAEWALGDSFCRAYGRTEDEAIANVLAQRDESAMLHVTTGRNDRDATGADWRQVAGPVIGRG